jgi:orotate phosphoribosyltransferase
MLYGPAYKGIPLVSSTSIAYAKLTSEDMPFAFNRKEIKDHGEGGSVVGAALQGKVIIVDDVITAGISVRESVEIIQQAHAKPAGVLIALDRQERGQNRLSAIEEVRLQYKMPVISIITLSNIIDFLAQEGSSSLDAILEYQRMYGA